MKYIVILFVTLSCTLSVQGQDPGKIIIRNSNPNYPKFIVSLNAIRLSNEYSSQVNFDYLEENTYKAKILQAGSRKQLTFMVSTAPNYASTYILTKDNSGNYSLILENKSLLTDQNTIPESTVSTVPETTVATAMPDADYNDMVKAVKKESLESARLEMAKTFFGNQKLSSVQVLGILKVFSLENSRVNFAKFAYSRTIDKQNYFKVYDAFNLSGSKKEMSEYIKNNP